MRALALILRDPALALIAVAILAFGSFAASIAPYQSLMAVTWFGLPDAAFSAIYAAGSALSLLCAIGVGVLTDRTGRRRNAARLAALAGIVGPLLVWTTGATWAYVLAHTLIFPVSATLFAQLFTLARLAASTQPEEDRAAILVTIRALFAVPWVTVLPLWSWGFGQGLPLISVYLACAGASALTFTVFVAFWPQDGRTRWSDAASGLSVGAALSELAAGAVLVRTALLGATLSGIQLYLILTGLVLTSIPGRDTGDVALFAGAVAGLEIPFMLALAAPLRRFGKVRIIAAGALIHAVFLAVFPVLGATPAVWALPLVAAMGASAILTVPLQYLQDLLDARPGAGGSLIALCTLSAQMLSAAVFALGTALGGYAAVSWMGAAMVASGGLGLLWVDRDRRA